MGTLDEPAGVRHVTERLAAAPAFAHSRGRARAGGVLGGAAVVLASIGLFLVSRGKWSDAIIDTGREWIVPDALARGELLYRDVVYWFGPFTPYFHAAFFRLFGSSFPTLVLAGIVGSIGVLVALHFALRSVTGPRQAMLWTALAIPALVFMPNAGGPILGMGYRIWHAAVFTLAAITLGASAGAGRRPVLRALALGFLCALAGLCRTEWGVVSLLAVWLALGMRSRARRPLLRDAAISGAAFAVVFGGALGYFVLQAGWKAVIDDNHLLLTGLPSETREFLVAYSGIRDWKTGIGEMVYSAAMWCGVFLLVEFAAVARADPIRRRKRLRAFAALLAVLGGSAALGGAGGATVWSAAPVTAVAGLVAGALRRHGKRAAGLAGFGFAGAVLSLRRPFHITDTAYVGPPLLFALVCAAGLVHFAVSRERRRPVRARLDAAIVASVVAVTAFAVAARVSSYTDDPRIPIPGTGGMLSARPAVLRELSAITEAVRRETGEEAGLVVLPEGEILNQLTGRRNPIRYKLYIPGYLTVANEREVAFELLHARPAAVVLWNRPTGEYGRSLFGVDYGVPVMEAISNNCDFRRDAETTGRVPRTSGFRLAVCRFSDEVTP